MENSDSNASDSPLFIQVSDEYQEENCCWICLNTKFDDEEIRTDWVSLCQCSLRWVHEDCAKIWTCENLRQNKHFIAECPQCKTRYVYECTEINFLVQILNTFDRLAYTLSPYIEISIVFIGVFWTATCYGALTVMQIYGAQKSLISMERTDPVVLFGLLPVIPFGLMLISTINWEETLLVLAQQLFTVQSPLFRSIMPSIMYDRTINSTNSSIFRRYVQTNDIFANFLLPTTAFILGKLFFAKSSYSNCRKTLLGGIIYTGVKWALSIYQRQQNTASRRVIDYADHNNEESS